MPGCFADRLGDFVELTQTERDALDRLEERSRNLRRGAVLVREKDPLSELFLLQQGMMMSYVLLADGSRQILHFYYPGDLLALSALAYPESTETIVAQTDCVLCPFDRSAMTQLVGDHPRLAGLIMALNEVERVALTDRVAELGRSSAMARIAALLLGLRNRMRNADPAVEKTFVLGLTQEEIGDATGLTAVHVNRMLRRLEDEALIARESGRVTIRDEAALVRAANYVNRHDGLDLDWLPAPR